MNRLTLLERKHHQDLMVDTSKQEQHAADQRLMPIVMSEFQRCANHFPIMIVKNAETGQFTCAAIFGFDQGENLFWKHGQWDALYTPLNVQRQPFFLGNRDPDSDARNENDYVLCIDQNSPCVSDQDSQSSSLKAIFSKDGHATPFLIQIQKTLGELVKGETETKGFLDMLVSLELVVPLSLDITFNNNEAQRVDGVYTISEEKLARLDEAHVLELHARGYMAAIYTLLVSLGQLYPLIERKNRVLDAAGDWFKAAQA